MKKQKPTGRTGKPVLVKMEYCHMKFYISYKEYGIMQKNDINIKEKYIDKKILIFADKFTDFFVKCKRKLDFLSGMIYSNRRVE